MTYEEFQERVQDALNNLMEDVHWGTLPKDSPLEDWVKELTKEIKRIGD